MFSSLEGIFLALSDRDFYMVVALCCLCAVFLRELIQSTIISITLIPFFVLGAVVTLHVMRKGAVLIDAGNDGQIVAATALGVTLTFLVLAVIFDLFLGVTDWRLRRMMQKRFGKN